MGIRKNQAVLTPAEKKRFIGAVLELKRRGRYDTFVKVHQDIMMRDFSEAGPTAHGAASFLPWHRKFLIDFERELQAIDRSVTLPYWDWTVDRGPDASIWAEDMLGGNGIGERAEVMTGPFAFRKRKWKIVVRDDDRNYLVRMFGDDWLPTAAELAAVFESPEFDMPTWDWGSAGGFRPNLEGVHGSPHIWVGGQMATSVSPNDPAFWLHHAFIDKCWSDWQKRYPGSGYLPTGGTDLIVDLNEPMQPWPDVTPADMETHDGVYTYA